MIKKIPTGEVILYQAPDKSVQLEVKLEKETVWLSQKDMGLLFAKDVRTINEHIQNIFKEGELETKSVIRKFRITASDGKKYETNLYNLDVIISVGYRVKSKRGTQFRIWATSKLKEHLVKGYTINRSRIGLNYAKFMKSVEEIQKLLPGNASLDTQGVLDLIRLFADTWISLDAYDKAELPKSGASKRQFQVTAEELREAIAELKKKLQTAGATDLFATERQTGNLSGIVGNILQSFSGQDLYPSPEEKAAHLLYFMVKNHPFVDGNKRSGAFAFIWFLKKAKLLNPARLTPAALTALTLLVAESAPREKDRMIGLMLLLLKK